LEEGFGVDVIYLDYKKAFDMVPHKDVKCKANGLNREVLGNWNSFCLTGKWRIL